MGIIIILSKVKMAKGDTPKKSKKSIVSKPESVKKPKSMKKASQSAKSSKNASPKKTQKSKKDSKIKKSKKSTEKKLIKSRKSKVSSKKESKKSKKSKKDVDPDKPKRPMSGYMLWVNDKARESIRKSNPEMSMKDVIRECGSKWGSLAASQKKVYEDKADVLKKEYSKTMEEYSKKSSMSKKSSKK